MQDLRSICLVAALLAIPAPSLGQRVGDDLVLDLAGEWQFRTGDNPAWKMPAPDQGDWSYIRVPGGWESQGFENYDGYAWYRRAFKLPPGIDGPEFVLLVGRIDDADEVFVNGRFVGATGSMPPWYTSAYDRIREYSIPAGMLNPKGENVVAIRVYDAVGDGGIMDGRVGISVRVAGQTDIIRLDGLWAFRTGDDPNWADIETSKEGWVNVTVPGYWEPQGFRGYDGYAWYRKEFFLPAHEEPDEFVLTLGKIDDLDATYINGVEIGHTGPVDRGEIAGNEWQRVRRYDIPFDALRFGDFNVIAVRVYDGTGGGGLFEGPYALHPKTTSETSLQKALKGSPERTKGS